MSRGLSLLAGGTAFVLLVWSIALAWAYHRSQVIHRYAEALEETGWVSDGGELREQIEHAHRLVVWHPHRADLYLKLARLYQWRAYEERLWPELARQSQTRAAALIEEACRRRPRWGLAWALLAAAELNVERDDAKVEYALNRAMVLAPWRCAPGRRFINAALRMPT